MPARSRAGVALIAILAMVTAACGGDEGGAGAAPEETSHQSHSGTLSVLAAASLTQAFTELTRLFEAKHQGLKVTTSFGASGTVVQQVLQGAPADVLVTADEESMARATAAGAASEPRIMARNRLAIIVTKGNPQRIAGLADLAKPDVDLVLCAVQVPCGKFAAQALQNASVNAQPKSLEENVKGVVTKVAAGEADAGIVYVTDVKAAGDKVMGVDIPDAHNVIAAYPVATVKQPRNPEAARAWVDLVLSDEGRLVLAKHGFMTP